MQIVKVCVWVIFCFCQSMQIVRGHAIDEPLKQPNCPFVLYAGTKKLVKRRAFEEFIEGRVAI